MPQYQSTADGRTKVPLRMEPAESYFVVFRSPSAGEPDAFRPEASGYNFTPKDSWRTITGDWRVEFDSNRGGPEQNVVFDTLTDWAEREEPSIKYYSGTAVYQKEIEIPLEQLDPRRRIWLDLGRVEVIAKVTLNEKPLGILWKLPFRVEITEAVTAGRNQLKIEVVNLWPNRMIGDERLPPDRERNANGVLREWPRWVLEGQQSPTGRYSFATWRHWRADSPLCPSGLLGPVTLQVEAEPEKATRQSGLAGTSAQEATEAMLSTPISLEATERQITVAPHGHILTNIGVWSFDGDWIVYDVRSDPAGNVFDGNRIERVHAVTGEVQLLFSSQQGAACGVVTASPVDDRVVFIHGPEQPTDDWSYSAYHRRGVIVHSSQPGRGEDLDARDLTPPFTPGALRGGTHVHTFSADGQWIAFTYEDHVLATLGDREGHDWNQRNVGVSVPAGPVRVSGDHPRNHHGSHFSVLVTQTVNQPRPGSDEISRAEEDSWIGTHGYLRPDGSRQHRAIAFQGQVVDRVGRSVREVFVVDLPNDLTQAGARPLQGTATTRPAPPAGAIQRRLTFTTERRHPGIQGPRHWLRSAPDGRRIAFLMKDDHGIAQLWTVSPCGGPPTQLTRNPHEIASAFTWSPNGRWIAHVMDGSVCLTDSESGTTHRLTEIVSANLAPRPEACVFSPDGLRIAYIRPVVSGDQTWNQIFVLTLKGSAP